MKRLPLLLALAAVALLGACRRAPEPAAASGADKPSLTFQGFEARASHRGQLVWEAKAVSAEVYRQGEKAMAKDVTMEYFVNGRRVSTGRADRASMDLKLYDMDAEGNVVVHGANGVVLETPRLTWDNKRQRASSTAHVRLTRGGTVLTGKGFSADRSLGDVRILEDVQAEAVSVQQLRKEALKWPKR